MTSIDLIKSPPATEKNLLSSFNILTKSAPMVEHFAPSWLRGDLRRLRMSVAAPRYGEHSVAILKVLGYQIVSDRLESLDGLPRTTNTFRHNQATTIAVAFAARRRGPCSWRRVGRAEVRFCRFHHAHLR